jgi:hypothetical protein
MMRRTIITALYLPAQHTTPLQECMSTGYDASTRVSVVLLSVVCELPHPRGC